MSRCFWKLEQKESEGSPQVYYLDSLETLLRFLQQQHPYNSFQIRGSRYRGEVMYEGRPLKAYEPVWEPFLSFSDLDAILAWAKDHNPHNFLKVELDNEEVWRIHRISIKTLEDL